MEKKGNLVTAFRPREESRSSSSDRRSQLTDRHRGISTHCFKKRRRNSEKAVSHKKNPIHPVLHPYLNSSVHFAHFSADPDNIQNMTRSWINSKPPRYVAEKERDTFLAGLSFFLSPLNLGSEVTVVERRLRRKLCVTEREEEEKSPAFKKAGYCPREISRENNWVFAPLLCCSARKYLQDDWLRRAQPLPRSLLSNWLLRVFFFVAFQV